MVPHRSVSLLNIMNSNQRCQLVARHFPSRFVGQWGLRKAGKSTFGPWPQSRAVLRGSGVTRLRRKSGPQPLQAEPGPARRPLERPWWPSEELYVLEKEEEEEVRADQEGDEERPPQWCETCRQARWPATISYFDDMPIASGASGAYF